MAKKTPKRNRTWAVSLVRKRREFPGYVEAPDREAAEAAAVTEFNLNVEQRKRLVAEEQA
jgi:hypothetical protein